MISEDAVTDWTERLRSLFHYWFVQYNPLYFFSAFCILFGTFLVSKGLEGMTWDGGQILLTAVIQAYEILLIAGVALLFRVAGQYRPAAILAIMEVVFLFDPTFRSETITTLGTTGLVLSAAWVIMVVVKLTALAWAFELKPSLTALIVPALAAVGMTATPHALALAKVNKETIHLIATWYAAGLVGFFLWTRPSVQSANKLDEWGQTVLRRSTRAAWIIWTGFYIYHSITWLISFSITLTSPYAAPFLLLLPLLSKREISTWGGCLGAIAVTSIEPFTVAPTAVIVAVVLGWQAYRSRRYRLYVGAVMSLYLAAWTIGWESWPLPEPKLWLSVTTATILLVMAWRLRLGSALFAVVVAMLPAWKNLAPHSTLGWGILLLGIGFLTLIFGVAVYWTHPQPEELDSS